MKIESIVLKNFRCFGPDPVKVDFEPQLTGFVGNNGSGKTAIFQAISRLFGISAGQRTVRSQDFHIPVGQEELPSGTTLSIEAIFTFPELEGMDQDEIEYTVPAHFIHMAASAPGEPLKSRIHLLATWTDDGTPYGAVDEDIRWINTMDEKFNWDDCHRVRAVERGSIQFIYVPATRDVSSLVTSLLKGRLWQAAKWSKEFRDQSTESAQDIQSLFEKEEPTQFIIERLSRRWQQVHDADTDSNTALHLVEHRFEQLVRKAEFTFYPNEAGQERSLSDLSDGQRSLFHISLTAATLEVERDAMTIPSASNYFEQERLRRTHLTLVAIEEPENSLSPFFLSRIIEQAREISEIPSAQVALSSHSAAILSRLEPEEVRYFRLNKKTRQSSVRPIKLPTKPIEAKRYVRLAVRAYPELYFARFVILGEGDSERLVIPRIADAMGIQLDPSFVPIVPLGGRYVSHFWKLLSDLSIPFATLLDFDLGRAHGGANTIRDITSKLKDIGHDLNDNAYVKSGDVDFDAADDLEDKDLFDEYDDNVWLQALKEESVFFSYPLDIDFSMLYAFPKAYKQPRPGGHGPKDDEQAVEKKKALTLKTDGKPELYHESYDEYFKWYPYLFLSHSKTDTHLASLSHLSDSKLAKEAPPELKALIKHVKEQLGL